MLPLYDGEMDCNYVSPRCAISRLQDPRPSLLESVDFVSGVLVLKKLVFESKSKSRRLISSNGSRVERRPGYDEIVLGISLLSVQQ